VRITPDRPAQPCLVVPVIGVHPRNSWYNKNGTGVRQARVRRGLSLGVLSVALGLGVVSPIASFASPVTAAKPGAVTTIGDRIWADGNRNGLQDAGEKGINGVTVRFVAGTNELASTVSADSPIDGTPGWYQLAGVPAGTAGKIELDRVADYLPGGALVARVLSPTAVGTDRNRDSDGTQPGYGFVEIASVKTGAASPSNGSYDVGFAPAAALIDQVWFDANSNGRHDADEPGINGVDVSIYDAVSNQLLGETHSATDPSDPARQGVCFFDGLPFGVPWRIALSNPADFAKGAPLDGLSLTEPHAPGTTETDDSDALNLGGVPSVPKVLSKGDYSLNATGDFGFRPLRKGERRPPITPTTTNPPTTISPVALPPTALTPTVITPTSTMLKTSAPVVAPAASVQPTILPVANNSIVSPQIITGEGVVGSTSPSASPSDAITVTVDGQSELAGTGNPIENANGHKEGRVIRDHSLVLALTSDSADTELPSNVPATMQAGSASDPVASVAVVGSVQAATTVTSASSDSSTSSTVAGGLMLLGLVGLWFARRLR
jgi:SdrD B-like domain